LLPGLRDDAAGGAARAGTGRAGRHPRLAGLPGCTQRRADAAGTGGRLQASLRLPLQQPTERGVPDRRSARLARGRARTPLAHPRAMVRLALGAPTLEGPAPGPPRTGPVPRDYRGARRTVAWWSAGRPPQPRDPRALAPLAALARTPPRLGPLRPRTPGA